MAEHCAQFRFYEELNDFLRPARRKETLDYAFDGHPGVKDSITHGYFVRSDDPMEQAREVLDRFDLRRLVRPFLRCLACNGLVTQVLSQHAHGAEPLAVPAGTAKPFRSMRERVATILRRLVCRMPGSLLAPVLCRIRCRPSRLHDAGAPSCRHCCAERCEMARAAVVR